MFTHTRTVLVHVFLIVENLLFIHAQCTLKEFTPYISLHVFENIWSLYCFRGIIYKKSAILVGLDEISLLSILFLQLSHVSRVQRWTSSTVRTICCYYLMNFNSSCLPQIVSVHLIFCDEKWLECKILTYNCMTCL